MRQSPNVIHIQLLRHLIPALRNLRQKSPLLLHRIIQFGKAVSHFHPRDKNLKAFCQRRIVGLLFRQRRNICRKIVENRRLDELFFRKRFEQQSDPLSIAERTFSCGVRRARRFRPGVIPICNLGRTTRRSQLQAMGPILSLVRPILNDGLAHGQPFHLGEIQFVLAVFHHG